jgi:hypothetical protein
MEARGGQMIWLIPLIAGVIANQNSIHSFPSNRVNIREFRSWREHISPFPSGPQTVSNIALN